MGDLVRDALHATGIDEKVEQLIANAIVQSWSENCSKSVINQPTTERKLKDEDNRPNLVKVRIIAEHLCRRLEQIYDVKLQTWKRNEEKTIEKMITRLRHEYRENLLLKQKQLEELAKSKDDEYKNKEDFLRKDIQMTFENKKLECERAWREIEMAQKQIRFQKELLDNARANFQSKKDNELCLIEQERCSLAQIKDNLKIHEKNLDERLKEAIRKAREKDKAQITQMIFEWNKKEAALSKKYGLVWNKICEISTGQQLSAEEAELLKQLREKVIQQHKKLTETKQALSDALHKQGKTNEDLERVKKEKEKLSETNQKLVERLERRNATINSLKKQLKLLKESAALRINELKFQHKLAVQKLNMELQGHRIRAVEKFKRPTSHPTTPVIARITTIDSTSSSTLTESSSFGHHFRDRMEVLNSTKQELDFALEKLRARSLSQPPDYIQSISLSHAEIHELEKPVSKNSSHEIDNTEVEMTSNSPRKHTTDPLMIRYMEMIQHKREKVDSLLEQIPKREDAELAEESFLTEVHERPDTPNTPSDFGW
uniref:Coiled-coil domain-containing protein 176 n=1 Tax=Elaeophora elaphi TaxID=1147741 RepID=A0A0R3RUP0_9BILA